MTTLDRYILREHLVPFVFGFSVLIFLLSMDFIFDYLDLFVTKGVPGLVVLELYILGLGWMVAMAVPCATLVAPLMAFGRMAQDNEITALRAGGVHLFRVMLPVLVASVLLTVGLTLFNNHILPESNHAFANLMIDISRKKPAVHIQQGVFVNDLPGYSLLVDRINQRTAEMEHITIYELKTGEQPTTIVARRGKLAYSQDGNTLSLDLRDGEIHEVPDPARPQTYRRMAFDRHVINIKNVSTALERTDRSSRGDRERSTRDMLDEIDELRVKREAIVTELDEIARAGGLPGYEALRQGVPRRPDAPWWQRLAAAAGSLIRVGPDLGDGLAVGTAADSTAAPELSEVDAARLRVKKVELKSIERRISTYRVEIHKKFAIPVACIVFVLIGAPLGLRARRGGVGIGFISLVFFVFYYICLIGGEQLADRSVLPPGPAMWLANVVIGALGLVTTARTIEAGRHRVRSTRTTGYREAA